MTERTRREVVSFVRRSTRMRPPQRRAWDRHHADFVLEVPRRETSTSVHPDGPLDLREAFGRSAPLIVEIGPGTGESLVPMARARPEANMLGLRGLPAGDRPDPAPVLGRRARSRTSGWSPADAVAGLTHLLPPASVAELWTFFPDPWPKARHHKRRLLTAEFVDLAASRLKPGGLGGGWPPTGPTTPRRCRAVARRSSRLDPPTMITTGRRAGPTGR